MQSIPIGASGSFSLVVMPEQLASRFKDVTSPLVLATPVMIMVMGIGSFKVIRGLRLPPHGFLLSLLFRMTGAPARCMLLTGRASPGSGPSFERQTFIWSSAS